MYDLIILDVLMPKIDGFTLCEMIKCENKIIPIIILTALDDEDNEIKAFDLNIDDYIKKPFSIKVLLKRVENVLRKNILSKLSFKNLDTTLTYKNININTEKHKQKDFQKHCYYAYFVLHNVIFFIWNFSSLFIYNLR